MVKIFLLAVLVIFTITVSSQDTIYNTFDKNGLRTGYWKSYYENGGLRYSGFFINGKPAGQMKKYYKGGLLQADMFFDQAGIRSYVKMFNEQGKLIAEGKYIEKIKDSTWNYYSTWDGRLAMLETYKNGKKDGISSKFYSNGKTSEILEWKDDAEHGKWEQYFENGDLRLNCSFVEGKKSGKFQSFYPGGIKSITGEYKNGMMDGKWIYFTEKGEEVFFIEYIDGKMLPNKVSETQTEEFSRMVEETAKKAGVDIENYPDTEEMNPF